MNLKCLGSLIQPVQPHCAPSPGKCASSHGGSRCSTLRALLTADVDPMWVQSLQSIPNPLCVWPYGPFCVGLFWTKSMLKGITLRDPESHGHHHVVVWACGYPEPNEPRNLALLQQHWLVKCSSQTIHQCHAGVSPFVFRCRHLKHT